MLTEALSPFRNQLIKLKDQNVDLLFRRDLIAKWVLEKARELPIGKPIRILDFGCGRGDDLQAISEALIEGGLPNYELYGIECYTPSAQISEAKGIRISPANIERDPFPFDNRFFDVVLSNQTIEHTKEIFWIFSEVSRVLKTGGLSITGVPNLASLHNRLMLLWGEQPTSIDMLGPHVRGITAPSFRKFIEADGYYQVIDVKGGHFYPFPRTMARILSFLFPRASASLFIKAVRTSKPGSFSEVLDKRFFETPFYKGESKSFQGKLQS
jgi:SAM-dependent methyltransferase